MIMMKMADISETNVLVYACARLVTERLNVSQKGHTCKRCHRGKRGLKNRSKSSEQTSANCWNGRRAYWRKRKKDQLNRMYKVNQKGLSVATEEVRQRLVALSARLQRYEARHKQYRQNQLFKTDQKQLYQELGGQEKAKQAVPDATVSRKFWRDLWDQPVKHNSNAEWLSQHRTQAKSVPQQRNICITRDAEEQQLKGMANWKAPGLDEVHAFWIKNFTKLYGRTAKQLQQCLTEGNVPEWMVLWKMKQREQRSEITDP